MIDKTPAPKASRDPLPPFFPVPRHYNRHDGWTPERQRGFIEALADTGSVKAAAHAVNMTPESAYQLRRHAEAGEFNKAWERALKLGVQRLEDVAMERALNGVEVPVYSYGKLVGTRRSYNDKLLIFLLRNRAPKRFKADSWHKTDVVTRRKLEKLKQQWLAEWEEERRAESEKKSREALEGINDKLETMRQRDLAATPPEARAHWHAYERAMGYELTEFPEWEPDEDEDFGDDFGDDGGDDFDDTDDIAPPGSEADDHAATSDSPAPGSPAPDFPAPDAPAPGSPPPEAPRTGPRVISFTDPGWNFLTHPNDGRCTPY